MPVISTNTAANTAVRFLNRNSDDQSNSLAKLASGSNINKASDDAAGLAIATKISTDVAALEQASTNASHAVSVLNTADGGASNIADIVERMKTLASQSASGTVTDVERAYIQAEFSQLQDEIDGITESTRYNGQGLLDGSSDFSVDDTETAAAYTSDVTGTASTSAMIGADGVYIADTANEVVSIKIGDGTNTVDADFTLTNIGDKLTAQQIADGINTAVAGDANLAGKITASVDDAGNLSLTGVDGTTVEIADGTALANTTLADVGLDNATSVTAAKGYANASATAEETIQIEVGGSKLDITAAFTEGSGTALSNEDLAAQIETGLHDDGNYQYEVAYDSASEAITITSLATGDSADVTIAGTDSDGGLNLAALGLEAGTTSGETTEVATTGAEIVVGSTSADTINLSIDSLTTEALGISDLDVSTGEGAAEALSVLDMAIDTISDARAKLGAKMSRFEFRSSQIDTSVENLDAAKSAIADVDIAKEQASLSSSSVKVQAAVAAASQANDMPQNLLSLIQ
uniref:flagellin N-terminal helical domain-containing protein n=2 Tax=Cohaesibacter marisflavi TaxID=655353 RepID=UPI00389945C3